MRNIKDVKKNRVIFISIAMLIAIIALVVAVLIDNSHKVAFEDATMAEMISKSAGVETVDKIRENDLEKIEELNIGYTGYYDTLVDIEKCTNLRRLIIGYPDYKLTNYPFAGREEPKQESKERVKQIEKELGSILEKCPNITTIYLSNENGNCELDNVEFLKKGKKLIVVSLYYQGDIDYSPISEIPHLNMLSFEECNMTELNMLDGLTELESLWIEKCDVSKAGEIVNVKSLKELEIEDTLLAGNAEELEIIFESCPNIEELKLSSEERNLNDLNFLRNAKNLEVLSVENQSFTDYSAIAECLKLKNLSLSGCNISDVGMLTELNNLEYLNLDGTNVSEAKDILKLKNLKSLSVTNTPLAENEEQLELIQKKFLKENTYK